MLPRGDRPRARSSAHWKWCRSTLIGYEAWENIRLAQPTKKAQWIANYKWPIYFFVAVAFWNLVGAGLFGFLINPPIALYYMQGLNLTPVHGHTALFGVYGMLGLGLTLFCLRALGPGRTWKEGSLKAVLLVHEYWPDLHGHPQHAAGRPAAGRGPPLNTAPGMRVPRSSCSPAPCRLCAGCESPETSCSRSEQHCSPGLCLDC